MAAANRLVSKNLVCLGCRSIHLTDVDSSGTEASCGRLVSDLSMQDFLSR